MTKAITDVGEFIPLARKESYTDKSQLKKVTGTPPAEELLKDVVLKTVWPEPNWLEIFSDGLDKDTLAQIYSVYHSLAKKPHKTERYSFSGVRITNEMWVEAYKEAVAFIREGCENAASPKDMSDLLDRFTEHFTEDDGTRSYKTFAAGTKTAKTFLHPLGRSGSAAQYRKLLPYLDFPERVNPKKIKLFPIKLIDRTTNAESYSLCKVNKKSVSYAAPCNEYQNDFPTYQEAVDALVKYHGDEFTIACNETGESDELLYIPKKPLTDLTSTDESSENIHPITLMNQFGFRGIQFGNCLSGVEKQQFVNHTHTALSLLADVLNISDLWIGGGKLGMAFASRGRGNASAHYEPKLHVINLTRFNGPGCIAHEFWHSLDQRLALKWLGYDEVLLSATVFDAYFSPESIPNRFRVQFKAFMEMLEACCYGEYAQNAKNISSQKNGRKYWDLPEELLARAFEAYVQDTLIDWGIKDQWLAYGTQENDFVDNGKHPYPVGEERIQIKDTFTKNLKILFNR
ncbi:hypothetical protein F0267_00525 [Vibrio coralliilyticus]|uniref:Large polyvalent protein-associated domain-containing protein n=1 Tax=Vibrio coralliilyticus TaxID=190893 RepID=A0AAN0SKM7_9VIBR|nr:LPD1 domain-containing protein [Vibrio coralliilyticus]AIW22607.1 hypothetical protein IX92_26455 [Vibrio coralliilyticus]NOH36704.1 hypothetical protein [Vibrio coralliilyticus]